MPKPCSFIQQEHAAPYCGAALKLDNSNIHMNKSSPCSEQEEVHHVMYVS